MAPKTDRLKSLFGQVIQKGFQTESNRPEMGRFIDTAYSIGLNTLQEYLTHIHLNDINLVNVFHKLYELQMDNGFIQDDLSQVRTFRSFSSDEKHFLIGQYNPRRLERARGAGRTIPPPGVKTAVDKSCFLCADNIYWQQRGIQFYYHFQVNGDDLIALCNPFPFMPIHLTIATLEHEPQSWIRSSQTETAKKVLSIITILWKLSEQLPGFVGFYNGVGAGASIEKHLHYQFFKIPDGHDYFPIQVLADIQVKPHGVQVIERYPMTAFRSCGENAIDSIAKLANRWIEKAGDAASANIAVMWEKGERSIYFIPRNKYYSISPGLAGRVGGLESLGEIIFVTEKEEQAITCQVIDYDYMYRILKSVSPPGSLELAKDI